MWVSHCGDEEDSGTGSSWQADLARCVGPIPAPFWTAAPSLGIELISEGVRWYGKSCVRWFALLLCSAFETRELRVLDSIV